MKKSFSTKVLVLCVLFLGLFDVLVIHVGLPNPVIAAPQNIPETGAGDEGSAVGAPVNTTPAGVRAYWTPARMATAVEIPWPKANVVPGGSGVPSRTTAAAGPAMLVDGSPPGGQPSQPHSGTVAGTPTLGTVTTWYAYPFPFIRAGVFPLSLYTAFPWRTNGKVFFSQNGGNYVCSGTSAGGNNRRLVWTAGHCVHNGDNLSSSWSYNVLFCPAYLDGSSPYGCFPYLQLWTTNGWYVNGNLRLDQGVIVTDVNGSNQRVGDTVGWQGLAWNQGNPQAYWAFGYPQASPFNGNRMIMVTSSTAVTDAPNSLGGPDRIGAGNDMTGGSSGGGWIMGAKMHTWGYINGVNSWKYFAQPNAMYSPYFGDATGNLYNNTKDLFP